MSGAPPQHPPALPNDMAAYNDKKADTTWGTHNKIPSVGKFLESQKKATKEAQEAPLPAAPAAPAATDEVKREDARQSQQATGGKNEKEEAMAKARAPSGPTAQGFSREGERTVVDPVTGQKVVVKDAELKDFQNAKLFSTEALDPAKPEVAGPATNVPDSKQPSVQQITPNPVEPSNILLQQFPAPVTESVKPIIASIEYYAFAIIAALGGLWFFTAFGSGWMAFVFRSSLFGGLAFCVYVAHGIIGRKVTKEIERIRLDQIKQRGETHSPPTPESVEWLNSFVKVVWPLINPSMFVSLVDMIEDVMQASLPGFIDAVKIDDFTIGQNALRIVSMRALPDQPHESDYPKEEWIDQGDEDAALDPNRRTKQEKKEDQIKTPGETPEDEDQTGDYVNFEISFAYFAPPGEKHLQNKNISLIMNFFAGVHDWFHLPIPIWIAVESIVGTVRLRCQMVSQAPFIRNVTFTLMGVPAIEASAIPLAKALPNVLDLPLISGFVQSSIAAATSIYCAPKSMTLNIAQMLMGDGVKRDTKALGVLMITIHHAEGLSAQDDNGFSDPYVVLAFAKFGKPLFSTRIIKKDLNPVWEQTAFLLVSDDEVRANENLSVQLWDSDVVSADDLVGRIQVPLVDLMLKPNEVHERQDKLMGFEDSDSLDGTLSWSVAYYEKAKLNPALKAKPGVDHNLPKELQDHPELKVETTAVDTAEEADVTRTPPDPQYPSGVLSVIIHQINSLERQNLSGAKGKNREGQAGQDTDDAAEDANNIPSAYCEIILNDDMIFKTRVKQYSQMPFFEAGTEVFLHDFTDASVRVVVRDSRLREHDPILGIVDLPLRDILAHSSEVTRLFSLQDGVGFGKVNISVLFKGVKLDLPQNLRGWDTGTVAVTSNIKVEPVAGVDFDFKEKKLLLSTLEAKQKLPGSTATTQADGSVTWDVDQHIRLPTYDKYSSALFLDYGGGTTIGPLGKKSEAFAAIWLQELVDDEETEIRVPIVAGDDLTALRQNYLNDQAKKTHNYTIVGWLTTTILLDSGLDEDHEKYSTTQTARHEFETYDRVEGQAAAAEKNSHANDDGVIDKDEQRAIDRAHKKALESRHRGVMQVPAVRTGVWAKDGIKERLRKASRRLTGKTHEKESTVASEA
ncbi:hypothetical protein BCR35DRAFT_148274 [Leucosporidium creatinivorum]|uniref:C2 domain-containing protein n=1 Tax=Leucosporidium creatinivorum TaxID=106004 RepID=A0A1Y2EPD7_9BASI|nr:hypothetical protein BCR35DRAFT_148274 [Leucosporidium creatinivorum]